MDLLELKDKIYSISASTKEELTDVLSIVKTDRAVFPFNEYEYLICNLIEKKALTFEQYLEIRNEYISKNPNLWIFEISAPRGFGEQFAQSYIYKMCKDLRIPSRELDKNYSGQYDMWLDGIKIEVKASRAVDSNSKEPLYIKALSRNSTRSFLMNFQQLKPQCCDVFIWVAVFRDDIILWIMSSSEVENHPSYSRGQHRGNMGNEGQLHIKNDNIASLKQYEFRGGDLGLFIKNAAKRNC